MQVYHELKPQHVVSLASPLIIAFLRSMSVHYDVIALSLCLKAEATITLISYVKVYLLALELNSIVCFLGNYTQSI